MTLHETTVIVKKAGLGSVLGIIGIIIIVILFRVGVMLYNYYFPPKIEPPTRVYGLLKPINFPVSQFNNTYTYELQTPSGAFPADLPDRISVFPIIHRKPDYMNLENAINKVTVLGFKGQDENTVVKYRQLEDPYYEWEESKGFFRKIRFNINTFDFKLVSGYLSKNTVVNAQYISDEQSAIKTAQSFLETADLSPKDLDLNKTKQKNSSLRYVTYPELYSVQNGQEGTSLVKTTSLSKAQVIRVDLYQKNIVYDLITGEVQELKPKIPLDIPILYPNPPYSTMSFWVASGQIRAEVAQAYYTHQEIDISNTTATYRIKAPEVAWKELESNKAYIGAYYGSDNNILINNIYLGYYLGDEVQDYLMPIYVFEGNNGFMAYVSALTEDQLEIQTPNP